MKCSKGLWLFLLLALLCLLVIPLHLSPFRIHVSKRFSEQLFRNFTKKYNKNYDPIEFQNRLNVFMTSLENIVRLNTANNNASAHYGVTKFSDLNTDEFASMHLNRGMSKVVGARLKSLKSTKETSSTNATNLIQPNNFQYEFTKDTQKYHSFYESKLLQKNLNFVPLRVDWRRENVLRKVQAQGHCGACYAYSVIGMIEAYVAIHENTRLTLSVQQMIDCARDGNEGCEGGDSCLLLEWLAKNKINILTEEEYPLKSGENQTCQMSEQNQNSAYRKVQINDYVCESFIDNEEKILEIVANYGPVTVAVNAAAWQHYISGIIESDCDADPDKLDHAVQIVGFDRSGPKAYYIVQNSWGPDFGENGYIRIAIGNNTCGIATQLSLAKTI